MVEVGDVRRPATSRADLDRLAKRVQEPIAERVAHVRVIDTAELGRLRGELRQLVSGGVRAGWVVETARDAERPFLHGLAQQATHAVECPLVRRHVVPTQRLDA